MKTHVLVAVITFAWTASARGDAVGDNVRLADEQLNKGNFTAAERLLKVALAQIDGHDTEDPRRAVLLHNLGFVYDLAGNFAQAESCLKRAVDLQRSHSHPDEVRLASSIGNLAKLYVENGHFTKAERLGLTSVVERVESVEPGSPVLARLLANLGVLARHRRDFEMAERYHRRALEIWEGRAPRGVEIIETLNNLALVYSDAGRHREARKCFARAIDRLETDRSIPGNISAKLLANAGGLESRIQGPAHAEPYYRRAATLAEESVGFAHPLTGKILSDYAAVLRQLGKKSEARSLERRAKDIFDASSSGSYDRYSVDVSKLGVR